MTVGKFYHDYEKGSLNKFDFYSGSQITVWFGDIMIDDISSIQWARTQNKKPIYGYASQQFDAVAKGTIIIQGNFTINFRQRGYLSVVMDEIKYLYRRFTGNLKDDEIQNPTGTKWSTVRGLISLHLKNGTFGPQTSAEIKNIGDSEDFMQLAKAYEDVIWGNVSTVDESHYRERQGSPDVIQSEDMPDGFNILVTYGNVSGSEARTLTDQLQSTTKSLVGVHLIGESQVIQVGGQPVQEQYEFIARGSDEFIGTTR